MIREARLDDLDSIERLERHCFEDPWNRSLIESELRATDRIHLVYQEDTLIVGYVLAMKVFEELHVNKIGVAESARRKGIARELMRVVAAIAIGHQCDRISLEVRRSNGPARRFYESLGFAVEYVRRRYYPSGDDALVMSRTILSRPETSSPPATGDR